MTIRGMRSPTPGADEYHVAWITALPIELSAATTMLDEEYESSDDTALYTLGRVGRHNIVLVCLPAGQIGTSSTATTVAEMKFKFPALQIGLLVGVGGGVPSSNADVRLGDVVISQPQSGHGGVIQYDFGKIGPGGKHIHTGFVNAPPGILLSAITKLKSRWFLGRSSLGSHLQRLTPFPAFQRQNAGADVLFQADYEHAAGPNCDGCRKSMEIIRPPRGTGQDIVLHYGTIASGNQVIKHGKTRDDLSAGFGGILCFEMEAAGLLNFLPCVVIRGICDYADSHKNKTWHAYAAGNAAACAKELLSYVPTFTNSRSLSRTASEDYPGTNRRSVIDEIRSQHDKDVFRRTEKSVILGHELPTPEERLGLHQLYPKSSQTLGPGFDVVAVHGLGDSHSTWTVDDTLWLRDLLPRLPSFQSARVMTFGYDARSFLRSLSLSLHGRTFTFAEALLNDLEDKRFSIADKNRPIIFIGHSLGGLVVKSALRHANERRSLYGTISSSTRAILFFGTPHQGCDVAAYLSGLGKAILLKNTEVVDELARWSAPLVELTTAFSEIAPRYNITTFFEQRPTNGVIIVPEASARMGQGNERVRGLDADHLSLCRFTGADGTWNMVANRLEAVADNIRNDMAGGMERFFN